MVILKRSVLALLLLSVFSLGCGSAADKMMARVQKVKRHKDEETSTKPKEKQKNNTKAKLEHPEPDRNKPDLPVSAPIPKVDTKLEEEVESRLEPTSHAEREQWVVDNISRISKVFQNIHASGRHVLKVALYKGNKPLLSWRVAILPQLGYQELYDKFHLNEPWDSPHNIDLLPEIPAVYQVPGRTDFKTTYLVPQGTTTAFPGKNGCRIDRIEDGVSGTIFLVNVPERMATEWSRPQEWDVRKGTLLESIGGGSYGGLYVAWGSGRVNKLKENLTEEELFATLTVDGGESISLMEIIVGDNPSGAIANLNTRETDANNVSSDIANDQAVLKTEPITKSTATDVDSLDHPKQDLVSEFKRTASSGAPSAFEKYYAALILEEDDKKVVSQYHWIPALKRPAAAIRWGVAVVGSGEAAALASPEPIEIESRKDQRIVGPGVSMIDFFCGDVSQRGLRLLLGAAESGRSGELISEAIRFSQQSAGKSNGRRDSDDDSLPAQRTESKFSVSNFLQDGFEPVVFRPGIEVLGILNRTETLKLARRRGIDVLMYFEVAAKKTSNRQTHNTTKVGLIDAQTGKTIFQSPSVNNITVNRDRRDPNKIADTIIFSQRLGSIFEQFAPADMVDLLPKHVESRIQSLDSLRGANPLKNMAEIRFYLALGLLSRHDAFQAISELARQQGVELPSGWDELKAEHLRELLSTNVDY